MRRKATVTRKPGGATRRRPKSRKRELIRLDDLIPKDDVKGGRGLFGATEPDPARKKKR